MAVGIPSSDGEPVVVDVSMGAVTWGDVIAGLADEEQLVPFGGEQWHKAFALAVGLQLVVDALHREEGYGAVLLVARPEVDPVPALRERMAGLRLPGDSWREDARASGDQLPRSSYSSASAPAASRAASHASTRCSGRSTAGVNTCAGSSRRCSVPVVGSESRALGAW